MPSKSLILLLPTALWLLSACTITTSDGTGSTKGDNVVGKPLTATTEMSDPNTADRSNVVVFDRTVRMIHQFDLSSMQVVKSLDVDNASSAHGVLFDQGTGMIADFSAGHMTIFDRASNKIQDPLPMVGKAQSYAYNPTSGTLVLYDDVSTTGLAKIGADGAPTTTWVGGPLFQNDDVLTSGDLIDDGSLIMSLRSSGSQTTTLAHVDVAQTLAQQKWIFTSTTTPLDRINWVAPVHGFNDRVLVKTDTQIALVKLSDGSLIGTAKNLSDFGVMLFESKTRDAHVILQSSSGLNLIYTDGTAIKALPLNITPQMILSSRLCISEDTWSIVTSTKEISWTYESGPQETEGKSRELSRFRLHDLVALTKRTLPDTTQIDVSAKFIFALYPSELGYGVRMGINDDSQAVIKMFNAGHIH